MHNCFRERLKRGSCRGKKGLLEAICKHSVSARSAAEVERTVIVDECLKQLGFFSFLVNLLSVFFAAAQSFKLKVVRLSCLLLIED